MQPVTIDDLKKVVALSDLPPEHLRWILDHSTTVEYQDGEQIGKTGDPVDHMTILVEGRLDFYRDVNGKLVFYFNFGNDTETGGVTGLLPYSRMKFYPGYSFAVGRIRALQLHKKYFPELEQLNPDFIQRLISYMTERAKSFATIQLQHEKVSALGKLSAGIAHELNNPASAINRISYELTNRLFLNIELTEKMLRQNINADHIQYLRNKIDLKDSAPKQRLSALERMKREDGLLHWLEANNIPADQQVVEAFTEAGFSVEDLENLSKNVPEEDLAQILLWIENLLSSKGIIKDLEEASIRISDLVGAIKSHVHMDRTHELQPTDIHNDIENTLKLFWYKVKEKNINVKKLFCKDIQSIPAYVGELNQVWTNIIDNAIYAVSTGGELKIETSCDTRNVVVKFIDNGPGIPAEIQSRIFDPFLLPKKLERELVSDWI
jgi:signal transduction histidine kinase